MRQTSMVAEITDIKGVGPAKAETLEDEGYETVQEIADAEPEELAEVDGVGDDRALEYIVGAEDVLAESQDEFDLTPSEVGEELEDGEDGPDADVSASDDEDDPSVAEDDEPSEDEPDAAESDADVDDEEPESYTVTFDFENRMQYDVYHAALMRHNERTSHQPAVALMEEFLDGLYGNEQEVTYQFTEYELNTLHAAVKQSRTDFQGANEIPQMDALKVIEGQLDGARAEYLF